MKLNQTGIESIVFVLAFAAAISSQVHKANVPPTVDCSQNNQTVNDDHQTTSGISSYNGTPEYLLAVKKLVKREVDNDITIWWKNTLAPWVQNNKVWAVLILVAIILLFVIFGCCCCYLCCFLCCRDNKGKSYYSRSDNTTHSSRR